MTSVIVPVYNGAHVLPETVPAMLAQSASAEWIFVDDGSTDATPRELRSLLEVGLRAEGGEARVLTLPTNKGRSGARNAGVLDARGDTIVFMDADVAPEPDAVQALVHSLAEPGVIATVGRYSFVEARPHDPYQRYLGSVKRGGVAASSAGELDWKYFLLGLAAVRAETLTEVGMLDPHVTYGEDLELACRLSKLAPRGLRRADAVGRLYDLGSIDTALRKLREFAGHLPYIVARHPEALGMVGLDLVGPEGGARDLAARILLSPFLARSVRRALPSLPSSVSDYAVRYLLGQTLYTTYRAATARS